MKKLERVRPLVLCLGAALLSGLLLVLSLPLGEQFYLAWIMLVPLLVVVRGRGFLWGFVLALVAIFFAAWLSVEGFFYAFRSSDGERSWNYTTFGIFGWSLAIAVGAWADKATAKLNAAWFALLGVLMEAVLLAGLPAHLALTQYRQTTMLWVASIGGIWLVSFLVWWSNFALAAALVEAGRDRKRLRYVGLGAGAILVLSLGTSFIRFSPDGPVRRFGVVQIQEPDEQKMAVGQRESAGKGAVLTVWPEFSGIPFVRTGHISGLAALSRGSSAFVTCFEDDLKPLPHNVAGLFRSGAEEAAYFKRKLFGSESSMHTPGTTPSSGDFDGGRAGLNICFDSCYPEVIRDTARLPGVNVVCLSSIDPEAPNNFVSAMHAAYTPFRAAEEVAMVKCDGAAYSIFVDSYGQTVKELPPGDRVAIADVPLEVHMTWFRRFGEGSSVAIVALLLFGLVLSMRSRKHEGETS